MKRTSLAVASWGAVLGLLGCSSDPGPSFVAGPTYPAGHPCQSNPCGTSYVELPDGGVTAAPAPRDAGDPTDAGDAAASPDGGAGTSEQGVVKYCFCGNG